MRSFSKIHDRGSLRYSEFLPECFYSFWWHVPYFSIHSVCLNPEKSYLLKIYSLSNDIQSFHWGGLSNISQQRSKRSSALESFPHLSNWALMRPMKYQTQHGTKHIPMFALPVSHIGEKQQINRSILPSNTHPFCYQLCFGGTRRVFLRLAHC